MATNVNKAEFFARVAAQTPMSKVGADDASSVVFSTIADTLASGETVTAHRQPPSR